MITKQQVGQSGEEKVCQELIKEGFSLLERNYRQRFGEIDIIATKKDLLIFVEVKARQSNYWDLGSVITPSKQKKILKVAQLYIAIHNINNKTCRFDVAFLEPLNGTLKVTYLPNGFYWGDCL